MARGKRVLADAAEVAVGILWWGGAFVWWAILGVVLALAPLLLAYLGAQLLPLTANAALGLGTVGAFALGLPPWDAGEPASLPIAVGGGAASAVIWDLTQGGAGVETLALVLALVVIGWVLRSRFGKAG